MGRQEANLKLLENHLIIIRRERLNPEKDRDKRWKEIIQNLIRSLELLESSCTRKPSPGLPRSKIKQVRFFLVLSPFELGSRHCKVREPRTPRPPYVPEEADLFGQRSSLGSQTEGHSQQLVTYSNQIQLSNVLRTHGHSFEDCTRFLGKQIQHPEPRLRVPVTLHIPPRSPPPLPCTPFSP